MTQEEKDMLKRLQNKLESENTVVKNVKKKGRFTKSIIVFTITFLILYTIACLFITYKTGVEPSTLTTSVFAFWGFEFGVLGRIKTVKHRTENNINTVSTNQENNNMDSEKMFKI